MYYEILEKVKADLNINKMMEKKVRSLVSRLPKGNLHCKIINSKPRYYHYLPAKNGSAAKLTYIPHKDKLLLHNLIQKKFLKDKLSYLNNNIQAEEAFIKAYKACDFETIGNNIPSKYRPLIESAFEETPILSCSSSAWQKGEYEKNPFYPENLKFRSQFGTMVRSKSEAIILSQLESYNIPCRYEARLYIADTYFYPDFTILSPKKNKIIYWEHFGMMDKQEYRKSMESKIRIYMECGIVQWSNFIATFETKDMPLSGKTVNNIIKAFLLPIS